MVGSSTTLLGITMVILWSSIPDIQGGWQADPEGFSLLASRIRQGKLPSFLSHIAYHSGQSKKNPFGQPFNGINHSESNEHVEKPEDQQGFELTPRYGGHFYTYRKMVRLLQFLFKSNTVAEPWPSVKHKMLNSNATPKF